jgi:hypothetical protein
MAKRRTSTVVGLILAVSGAAAGCDATSPAGANIPVHQGADGGAGAGEAGGAPCALIGGQGTVCTGGANEPGITGTSVNNQGLVGSSMNGRGVYGTSLASEGGYFSSTDGDGLLAYSTKGFSGRFTGGRGVVIDPPGLAGAVALAVNGPTRTALVAATAGGVPVCGSLDAESGLFTLGRCDDRLARLEADVAALKARLADAGAP